MLPPTASRRRHLEPLARLLGEPFRAQQIRCTRCFTTVEPRPLGERWSDGKYVHYDHEKNFFHAIGARGVPIVLVRTRVPGIERATEQLSLDPRLTPRDVLTGVFGYAEFRPGQEKIIATVLGGRDCIGVMPTGAGKSLTFQIPARLLPGTVLVVSPLISLMKDQVDALTRNGFRATVVNSTLDW